MVASLHHRFVIASPSGNAEQVLVRQVKVSVLGEMAPCLSEATRGSRGRGHRLGGNIRMVTRVMASPS